MKKRKMEWLVIYELEQNMTQHIQSEATMVRNGEQAESIITNNKKKQNNLRFFPAASLYFMYLCIYLIRSLKWPCHTST